MAQRTIQTVISIGGRIDNTFGVLGDQLTALGGQVDMVSQKVIDFGEQSVTKFVDYDDVMRYVQVLGEYDETRMKVLNEYNKELALTNKRFDMTQIAQAEVMIGQLGLTLEDTYSLMPSVMNTAIAANIEAKDSLNYLYYSLMALEKPLSYAGTLSDQMAKAAAISAADIDTLGLSLQRLGSGAQLFTGGSAELLAILSGISQFGEDMQGAEAGTQLRNFMLTLLAPTNSKEKLLNELKVTEEQWAEFEAHIENAGVDVTATAEAMDALAFSVYDQAGNLKPAIQIISELNTALSNLTLAERNEMLGDLFGKRTTITASNLMKALPEIIAYQDLILDGSSGYAQYMAQTVDGGLGGTLRDLSNSWDALQVTIGDKVAPSVERVAGALDTIVDNLAMADESTLDAIVTGGTALAVAGPGLMLAGGAFKLIGSLGTAGGLTLAAVALVSAAAAVDQIAEARVGEAFGSMDLDAASINSYVEGLGQSFKGAYEDINAYNEALAGAMTSYSAASTTFSGQLTTAMLTGATLTESDRQQLQGLGTQMYESLMEGITYSTAATKGYWEMLFGGQEAAVEDPAFRRIYELTQSAYEDSVAEAERLSLGLREAMSSAFADGSVSEEEYSQLLDYMRSYNDAMARAAAEAQAEEDYVNAEMMLHKAQSAGLDSIISTSGDIVAQRGQILAEAEEEYLRQRFKVEYRARQDGMSEVETDRLLQTVDEQYEQHKQTQSARYDDLLFRLWDSQINQSGLAGAYSDLESLAAMYLAGHNPDVLVSMFKDEYGKSVIANDPFTTNLLNDTARNQINSILVRMVDAFGGVEGIGEKIAFAEETGDRESADEFRRLLTMYGIGTNFSDAQIVANAFGDKNITSSLPGYMKGTIDSYLWADGMYYSAESAREMAMHYSAQGMDAFWQAVGDAIATGDGTGISWAMSGMSDAARKELDYMLALLEKNYNFDSILSKESTLLASPGAPWSRQIAAYSLLYGQTSADPEAYRLTNGMIDQEVLVEEAGAAGEAAKQAIMEAWGEPVLSAQVKTSTGGSWLGKLFGGIGLFAEGGRATSASIFGEAGAEWAIPESHTQRTASLLDAARAASGFSWAELIARNSGGISKPAPSQIIYSPVIYAQDASGVEQKLLDDKSRFEKWWDERKLRDELEVYA